MNYLCNDCNTSLSQALDELKEQQGDNFSIETVNLAELERKTGISRKRLRRLKKNGFAELPHALKGKKFEKTVLTGFTGVVDSLLSIGVTNSAVIFERLQESGYKGGLTQVKVYIHDHMNLVPAKRQLVAPQGNRGRRYSTEPGESYQMDWGFINVKTYDGSTFQVACFAIICHHCGERYIEFFPNARQESLFIGMIHAFLYMGVPRTVLTDNMKSVVNGRDSGGHPLWNHDYEMFMKTVGFETKLCKPRHPFTKGKVERLVRFVKENFIVGRVFYNITDLNIAAIEWCNRQNNLFHKAVDCVPNERHLSSCMTIAAPLEKTIEIAQYLCPVRKISFDGFVNYEGRRYGVPYHYSEHVCRVKRDGDKLYVYNSSLTEILTVHPVTWSGRDNYCSDQYVNIQPEEKPTMPVTAVIRQLKSPEHSSAFSKFNFDKDGDDCNV